MAALAYDSDSSIDESIRREIERDDEIIRNILNAYRGQEIFLLTPTRGLLKVTLGESEDPNYPPDTFLEMNMFNNNEKAPYEKFVRLGFQLEDDENPRLMPWTFFVFRETFPNTLYTKASLDRKLTGVWAKDVAKVISANEAWLEKIKENRPDVIDLTGEEENNLLRF